MKTTYTQQDDQIIVTREQNVGQIVDYAKAMSNEGFTGKGDAKFVATIPAVVIEHYCNTHGVTYREFARNPEHMRRILNDQAFADLRIAPGRVR